MENREKDYEFAIRILYHRQELTDKEVERWMSVPENLRILEEVALVRTGGMEIPETWVEEDKSRIDQITGQTRRRRLSWYGGLVAASVSLIFGVWLFIQGKDIQQKKQPVIQEVAEIVPGENKARLIMEDGEIVDLLDSNGKIFKSEEGVILNDSLQGLSYRLMSGDTLPKKERFNVLQVPTGGFYRLELADGTKVWLNAETELRYPVYFVGNERNVYLKGEAYFEVAKDVNRPFRVFVGDAEVKVLGTSFNISAYPEEYTVTTTLVEGSVGFRSGSEGHEIRLKPGFQCRMNVADGSVSTEKVDVSVYTAWVNGKFIFRFMNLESIMRQLQRWYGFETIYLDPEVRNYEFRGAIERESKIEDVFRAIELTTDVKFSIDGQTVKVARRNLGY